MKVLKSHKVWCQNKNLSRYGIHRVVLKCQERFRQTELCSPIKAWHRMMVITCCLSGGNNAMCTFSRAQLLTLPDNEPINMTHTNCGEIQMFMIQHHLSTKKKKKSLSCRILKILEQDCITLSPKVIHYPSK